MTGFLRAFIKKWSSPETGIVESVEKRQLLAVFLVSTTGLVFSALFLQGLITLQTALLMGVFSIHFDYQLFCISFYSSNSARWTTEMIFIVYCTGTMAAFMTGLLLLRVKIRNWKMRLAVTWLSFLMIHLLPFSVVGSIFLYHGFAVAVQWLIRDYLMRILISSVVLLILISCRPFWIFHFMKAAYSTAFFADQTIRKRFIRNAFIYPWIAGSLITSMFAIFPLALEWLLFLVGTGVVVIPFYKKEIPSVNVKIFKTEKKTVKPAPFIIISGIILIAFWIIAQFSFRF